MKGHRPIRAAFTLIAAMALSSCAYWWTYQGDLGHTGYSRSGIGPGAVLRWDATPGGGSANLTAPVFGAIGDTFRIFIGTGYGDRTLYALHPQTGAVLWHYTAPANTGFLGAPVAVEGIVYAATGGSANAQRVYALDQASGAVLWSTPLPGTGTNAALAVVTPYVIVAANNQELHAFDAATGAPRWPAPAQMYQGGLATSQASAPAVWRDMIFVGSEYTLYAFNLLTGAPIWTHQMPAAIPGGARPSVGSSSAVVALDGAIPLVLIGATDGLHAVNAITGTASWMYSGNVAYTSPAVADGRVFTYDLNGAIALDVNSGTVLWNKAIGQPVKSPAVGGHTVFYSDGRQVVGLDTASGALKWRAAVAGSPPPASRSQDMAMSLEILVVPTGGHVFAFK